jgi:hypothetical protein
MANRCTPGFLAKMKSELDGLNRTITEFLHNDGYKNIRSMDPWVGLRQLEVSQIWGNDSVHIRREHVAGLVEGVKITLSKLAPKRRHDSKEANFGPPSKRGKMSVVGQGGGSRAPAGGSGDGENSGSSGGRNGGGGGGPLQGGGGDRGRGPQPTLLQEEAVARVEIREATAASAVVAADSAAAAADMAGEGEGMAEWPKT